MALYKTFIIIIIIIIINSIVHYKISIFYNLRLIRALTNSPNWRPAWISIESVKCFQREHFWKQK